MPATSFPGFAPLSSLTATTMDDSHLFFSGEAEKEVAVHQNGQTAMRKVARSGEVADSNLYE
jgi:hypothetical protein